MDPELNRTLELFAVRMVQTWTWLGVGTLPMKIIIIIIIIIRFKGLTRMHRNKSGCWSNKVYT